MEKLGSTATIRAPVKTPKRKSKSPAIYKQKTNDEQYTPSLLARTRASLSTSASAIDAVLDRELNRLNAIEEQYNAVLSENSSLRNALSEAIRERDEAVAKAKQADERQHITQQGVVMSAPIQPVIGGINDVHQNISAVRSAHDDLRRTVGDWITKSAQRAMSATIALQAQLIHSQQDSIPVFCVIKGQPAPTATLTVTTEPPSILVGGIIRGRLQPTRYTAFTRVMEDSMDHAAILGDVLPRVLGRHPSTVFMFSTPDIDVVDVISSLLLHAHRTLLPVTAARFTVNTSYIDDGKYVSRGIDRPMSCLSDVLAGLPAAASHIMVTLHINFSPSGPDPVASLGPSGKSTGTIVVDPTGRMSVRLDGARDEGQVDTSSLTILVSRPGLSTGDKLAAAASSAVAGAYKSMCARGQPPVLRESPLTKDLTGRLEAGVGLVVIPREGERMADACRLLEFAEGLGRAG